MSMEMYKNVAERGSWARFFMQAGNQYKNVRFENELILIGYFITLGTLSIRLHALLGFG